MFEVLKNRDDSRRYNEYVATTQRPLERDTVAELLELARPIFEQRAHAAGMNVAWDAPVTQVRVTDYPLPPGMSRNPKIQRSYNLESESIVRGTFHDHSDENGVQKGAITILSAPHDGLVIAFRVPAVSWTYIKAPHCLDYMLRHERENLVSGFKDGVPALMSARDKKVFANAGKMSPLPAGPGA